MNEYDRYPEQELLAQAHLAAMEQARRKREEEAKRYIIELEKTSSTSRMASRIEPVPSLA